MIAIISLLLIVITVMAWAPGYGRGPHMSSGYIGIGIFWALVIIAVVFLVVCLSRRWRVRNKKEETLLDVLKQRYARGEIAKEEFYNRKQDLDKKQNLTEESLYDILGKRYARGEIAKDDSAAWCKSWRHNIMSIKPEKQQYNHGCGL
jgi:putative membrane protein